MNVITLTLNTETTYYVQEEITLELLKKFINKVSPDLSVCIRHDHDEAWLEMEGTILAAQYYGGEVYCNQNILTWESVEEIIL